MVEPCHAGLVLRRTVREVTEGCRSRRSQMSRIQELLTWLTCHRGPFFCIVGLYTHITNYTVNFRAYASRDKSAKPNEPRLVVLTIARWALESAPSGHHSCDPENTSRDCMLFLVFCRTEVNEKTTSGDRQLSH